MIGHPYLLIKIPAIAAPDIEAQAWKVLKIPEAVPRFSGGKITPIYAITIGKIQATATPCKARAASKKEKVGLSAAATSDAVKITIPTRRTFLLPYWSANLPVMG